MSSSTPGAKAASAPPGVDARGSVDGGNRGRSVLERPTREAPQLPLADRVALVTGGGRGIGRAIAVALATAGADVAVASRSEGELQAVAEEMRRLGRRAVPVHCDVTDAVAVDRMVRHVATEFGELHILVNNAGGAHRLRELQEVDDETLDQGIALNLTATLRTMRSSADLLFMHPHRAVVLNVVSIAAARGLERMSYYSAAKSGVVGLTRTAAREWGPRGVRVNCLGPGWIETSLSRGLQEDTQFFERSLTQIPMGRWGTPEDVAHVAVFLVSDAARYITGQTLYVDGGLLA